MGYSSYLCKHCDRGILSEDATDKGINEWMAEVVMLSPKGNMVVETEYSGYEGHYEKFSMNDSVWAHKACWELAGRPDYASYDGPSRFDPNQGAGGKDVLIVDPRITDEAERERILAEGLARRNQRLYEWRAEKACEMAAKAKRAYYIKQQGGEMWRLRYHCGQDFERDENGEFLRGEDGRGIKAPNRWYYYDNLDVDHEGDESTFEGTEAELKAHLAKLWEDFLASDELKGYQDFCAERSRKHREERIEQLKAEGRFKPTYGPRRIDGKEVWPVYWVADELYIEDLRDEFWHGEGCQAKAQAKADELNAAWAASGYVVDQKKLDEDEDDGTLDWDGDE